MAGKGITRIIRFVLDRKSVGDSTQQMEQAFTKAGKEAGDNFYRELRAKFEKTTAELREKLAKGTIDEKEFKKQSDAAAKAFNSSLLKSMEEARKKGTLTDREYVKLTKTLKKVGDDGGKAGSSLASTFGKVAGAIGAAFAVHKLTAFTKSLFQTAAESDAIWNRLAGTLDTVGIAFADVEKQIRANARAMQDATVVGDEDYAAVLTELISISQDYQASVNNMSIVADLAAGKQIDLRTAAQLVGKAMIGETGTLSRYGIIVKDGADAIELMRERFRGLAEKETRTLAGQMKQLTNEWGDFKEALGRTLADAAGGSSIIDSLTAGVRYLSESVEANGDTFKGMVSVLSLVARAGLGLFELLQDLGRYLTGGFLTGLSWLTNSMSRFHESLAKPLDALASLNEFVGREDIAANLRQRAAAVREQASALDRWSKSMREVGREAFGEAGRAFGGRASASGARGAAGNKPAGPAGPKTAAQLAAEAAAREKAAKAAEGARAKEISDLQRLHQLNLLTEADIARAIELQRQLAAQARDTALSRGVRATAGQQAASLGGITDIPLNRAGATAETIAPIKHFAIVTDENENVDQAEEFVSPWIAALDRIQEEAAGKGGIFEELGQAWANGGLQGLAQLAKGKVKQNLAEMVENFARAAAMLGFHQPKAAADFAKAGVTHGAAAAAWGAVGAAMGGGGGGGGGAGGGRSSLGGAPGNFAGDAARSAEPKSETHIYIDPLTAKDPRAVVVIGDIVKEAGRRDSSIDVHVHRRSGNGRS